MKKLPFDRDWNFILEDELDEFSTFGFDKYSDAAGAPCRYYEYNNWKHVDLPHDWTVTLKSSEGANTFAGAYPNTHYHRFTPERRSNAEKISNVGWYRKEFTPDPAWKDKRVFIEFDGVFRDATVWVNGVYLDRHTSGYTSFALELTDHLFMGELNSVAVRVDSDQAEGWWYEGAGIYRSVRLLICEPVYFKHDSVFVRSEPDGRVKVSAVLVNDTPERVERTVRCRVHTAEGAAASETTAAASVAPYSEAPIEAELCVPSPRLWSVDTPYLYTLELDADGETVTVPFGIRTVGFDPERGFLLNGKPIKVRGACVHQDFGGVGVALSDNLNEYKIRRLKEMGVNAYRCSHNAPSPALLDACDRLGMLVMDETRCFGTSPEAVRQLTSLIERDRNHPCVFIWSLGNEEFSVQNEPISYRLMEKMTRLAKSLDPTRPVTYGGNNGSDHNGANAAAEIRGVNYIRNDKSGDWLDEYHAAYPDQPIIGTEESSYVLSRGGAVNDIGNGLLDCSGDVTMPWGSTPKGWVKFFEMRDYLAGSFMWTGFDYRGEPNPFYYTNVISSFGTIDLCGMEKPPFYYYRAWWTDEPTLKLAPHWSHRPGESVKVSVFTNCEEITLYLNGKKLETKRVERFDAPQFNVIFEPGVLSVEGVRGGKILKDELVTPGRTASIAQSLELEAKTADDIAIYQLDARDENGNPCPLADEELEVTVQGGKLVGLGNGDPASREPEQPERREISRRVRSFSSTKGLYIVPEKAQNTLPKRTDRIDREGRTQYYEDDFRLVANYRTWSSSKESITFTASLTDAKDYEYVEFERLGCPTVVYLNGEKLGDNLTTYGRQSRNNNRPYRFYCSFSEGANELKLVCECGDYDPPTISGYVKLGRELEFPGRVKLHYGSARVFVRSEQPQNVTLNVKLTN